MPRRHVRGEAPKHPDPQIVHRGPSSSADTLDHQLPPGFREVLLVGMKPDGEVAVGLRLRLPCAGEQQDPHLWGQVLFRAAESIAHAASQGATMASPRGPIPVTDTFVLAAIMKGVMDGYEERLPADDDDDQADEDEEDA